MRDMRRLHCFLAFTKQKELRRLSASLPWIDGLGSMDEAGACNALGLEHDGYSASEVRRAYRRLALRYHPDKQLSGNGEEAKRCFRDITLAKNVLLEKLLGPVPTPPKQPKPDRPRRARWCVAEKVQGLELERPMSARPHTARPASAGVRGALTARSSGLPWPPETPRRPDTRPESAQMSTRAQPRSYAPHTSELLESPKGSPKGSKVSKSQDLPWLQTPNQARPAAALLGPVRAPVGTGPKHPERGRWAHPTVGL